MRQLVEVSAARVKTVFPPAVHLGDIVVTVGKATFQENLPSNSVVGEVPSVTAGDKTFQNLSP